MFTGLVECVGRVVERVGSAGGATRLTIEAPFADAPPARGDSVAIDGVCLTVVDARAPILGFDAIPETLSLTTLGGLAVGDGVNLERAVRVGDRLGGHLVQGHVDGTALVERVDDGRGERRLRLRIDDELARYVARKGSITLCGVSLTVAAVDGAAFEVALIPETLTRTTLGRVEPGLRVNVEVDLVARYLERLIGGTR